MKAAVLGSLDTECRASAGAENGVIADVAGTNHRSIAITDSRVPGVINIRGLIEIKRYGPAIGRLTSVVDNLDIDLVIAGPGVVADNVTTHITAAGGLVNGLGTNGSEFLSHLVGQLFHQAEAKQMGGVPAIRAGCHIAAKAGGTSWATMAGRAAIGEAGAQRTHLGYITGRGEVNPWPHPLRHRKFALKQLPATSD